MYRDRRDAGRELARELERFAGQKPVVLALPRGGVVVGAEIAAALAGDLDVLLVKKLRSPGNPELAVGAVSENGQVFINPDVMRITGADDAYVEAERTARLKEIAAQHRLYRGVRARIPPAQRVVIVVDDGLATGATMMAATQALALESPHKLVVAAPVGSIEAVQALGAMRNVDEVVCPYTPEWFGGVGQFYEDFTQVTDAEVAQLLRGLA
jgi:putative phosphoribosyl transferase